MMNLSKEKVQTPIEINAEINTFLGEMEREVFEQHPEGKVDAIVSLQRTVAEFKECKAIYLTASDDPKINDVLEKLKEIKTNTPYKLQEFLFKEITETMRVPDLESESFMFRNAGIIKKFSDNRDDGPMIRNAVSHKIETVFAIEKERQRYPYLVEFAKASLLIQQLSQNEIDQKTTDMMIETKVLPLLNPKKYRNG